MCYLDCQPNQNTISKKGFSVFNYIMIFALGAFGLLTQAKDQNPVISAVTTKNFTKLRSLINQKTSLIEVDATTKNTPLILAVVIQNNDMLKLLIDSGAQLNGQNIDGNTALHFAVAGGNLDAVEIIAKAGAKLDLKDLQGRTPLSIAIFKGKGFVEALLKYHANPFVQDNNKKTPYDLAAEHDLKDIVQLLIDSNASKPSFARSLWNAALGKPRTAFVTVLLNAGLLGWVVHRYGSKLIPGRLKAKIV
jgi:ankyrin repeat protein